MRGWRKGAVLVALGMLATACAANGDSDAAKAKDGGVRAATAPKPAPTRPAEPIRRSFTFKGPFTQGGVVLALAPSNTKTVRFNGEVLPLTPDGYFMIGFDRDAPPSATLTATLHDGQVVNMPLTIASGEWKIERVNARITGGAKNSAEFERRRAGELAQMGEARKKIVESEGWRQQFIWPVKGRLSGFFGSQRIYQGTPSNYHNGNDIAVPTGTPFVAPADGVVILAAEKPFTLEGLILMIDHGNGLSSVFLHNSRLDVKTGDVVRQGQTLGAVGATGSVTGPHMHWAMRWRGAKVDSLKLVGQP